MSLRKSVFCLIVTAGALGIIPASTWAQEQPAAANPSEIPNAKFSAVGEVTATSVNVRSGPAESHYPTMKLNKGDKVIVVGQKFDWLKIKPPQGSFSYVAKIYVDRDGAGTSGTVKNNDVVVRAGSLLSPLSSEPQSRLNTGDKVQILGEMNEYYKIVPPEDAYLYVAKQFVSLVRVAATGESVPPPSALTAAPTTKPAETAAESAQATGATPPAAQENEDIELQFRRLEARYQQAQAQALEDRPVADLLKDYQQLGQKSADLSSTSKRMVLIRTAELTAMQQQQAELLKSKQAAADFQAKQAELQAQRKAIEERVKATAVAVYTAVGQLQTSTLQKDGQTLLRLTDPADGQTLVYVLANDPKSASLIGQFVGVKGEVAKDARLSVDILEPTSIEPVDQAKVLRGVTAKIYPPSAAKPQ